MPAVYISNVCMHVANRVCPYILQLTLILISKMKWIHTQLNGVFQSGTSSANSLYKLFLSDGNKHS